VGVGHPNSFAEELRPHLFPHVFPGVNFSMVNLIFRPINRVQRLAIQLTSLHILKGLQRGLDDVIGRWILSRLEFLLDKLLRFRPK
jgi:hypothetical protein